MKKVFLIGEAGVNHNGKLHHAIELVDIAVEAGLDAVKFQTWKTELLLTKHVKKAAYQIANTGNEESQFEMIKKLELPFEDFNTLKKYCDSKDIMFLSSSTDFASADYLVSIGMEKFKVSSADLTNYPYLKHIAKYNKEIILSTGMANINEIIDAVQVLTDNGTPLDNVSILHCNTEYPTKFEEVNLLAMNEIREKTQIQNIGYSDHTEGIEVSIAAVALGAKIIEKHFTIDKNMDGPDHKASLEKGELKKMVESIRNIEKAISGNGKKVPSRSEVNNIPVVRKSIVAINPIQKGEFYTEDNIGVKRPGTGISPMEWSNVLGSLANKDYSIDDLIQL